jgi:N-acetylmuramoyl-L-alanine amidase
MKSKVAIQTLILMAAWLILQNFNVLSVSSENKDTSFLLGGKGSDKLPFIVSLPVKTSYQIKKVVLDAGHGGKDPGCLGTGTTHNYEKHNALAITLRLGDIIKANYPDVEVIYTRDTDVFIELKERAAIANRNNADLFISIHCNSLSVASAHGTETYVLGLHKAKHNLEVAKRENASIYMEDNYKTNYEGYDPDSPEAHILGSVWQSAYLEQSILLADFVQHHVQDHANRDSRGVKQAGFIVLKETAMPAILIETGYLTNSTEEAFLASDEGRDQMATSIFRAFADYKAQLEGHIAPKPVKQPKKTNKSPQKSTTPKSNTTKAPEKQATPQNVLEGKPDKIAKKVPKPESKPSCRIWLMSWNKRMDQKTGKLSLLTNVKEEKINDEYHYYITNFASCEEAALMLPEIQNLGFKQAKCQEIIQQ